MKSGKTLTELATEIQRQAEAKRDALVQTQSISMNTNGHSLMWLGGNDPFAVQNLAHRQLGEHLGVPVKWYDAMQAHISDWKAPDGTNLFDTTVNALLRSRPTTERRMVRTLDGNVRAFLSDKYRAIDHLPILASVLPVLQEMPGLDWANSSMEVTDNKLYLKLVNKDLQADIVPGTHNRLDVVSAGVVITNSEVGLGAFRVQPMLYRLVCSNGLIVAVESKAKYHVGGVMGDSDGQAYAWLADDTLAARSDATIKEMRDVVKSALNDEVFHRAVDSARQAQGIKVEGDPIKAVEWVTDRFGFNGDEQAGVLRNLITGGDLSLWGVVNAVTAHAQEVESYDRSTELEAAGGKLLTLPKHELTSLVTAN